MTKLLHIDSSIRYEGSVTREISGAFADVCTSSVSWPWSRWPTRTAW